MPRDILEPIDEGSFSIGSVAQRDEWLSLHTISGIPECNENGEPLDEEAYRTKKELKNAVSLMLQGFKRGQNL